MFSRRLIKFTILAVFLAVAALGAAEDDCSKPGECANPDAEDPSCPSRPHIIRCAAEYLDLNKNDKLERSELDTAIGKLNWLARGRFMVRS